MNDYLKLSADLSRVAEFLVSENYDMAKVLSEGAVKMYGNLPGKNGKYELGEYLQLISSMYGGREQAAERAYTAAEIILRRSNG